ncbi:MAG: DUF2004 domain-containing protein [Reichenbachiella sp.]
MGILDFFKKKQQKHTTESLNQESSLTVLSLFDQIDLNNLEDFYETSIQIGDIKIRLDLNFETKSINLETIEKIEVFLAKLGNLEMKNHDYIRNDFTQEVSMTSDYLNFYADEFYEEELSKIIDLDNPTVNKPTLLLKKLKLIRIGIYPQASYFATFDYSIYIDDEPCNQLLVVNINEDGSLDYITWES